MLIDSILVIVGCTLLYFGGERVVEGSSRIARGLRISPLIIGVTVVAFGTSLPEAFVSIVAALKGNQDICVSNIIGSNIVNIGLILGLAAFLCPLNVDKTLLRHELPFMLGISAVFVVMSWDYQVSRFEGAVLFVLFLLFNFWMIHKTRSNARVENTQTEQAHTLLKDSLFVLLGFALLVAGALLLVDGASSIAEFLGIPAWIIGITVVSIGTSLPELAASVIAALKKEGDISLGNIVGSNIFNILFVIGSSALIMPLRLDPSTYPRSDLLIMIAFSAALYPFLRSRYVLARVEGVILLIGYAGFMAFLFLRH